MTKLTLAVRQLRIDMTVFVSKAVFAEVHFYFAVGIIYFVSTTGMGRFSYYICFNLTRTIGKNKPFFLAEDGSNKWKNVPSGRKKFCSSKKLKLAFTSCVFEWGQAKFYHYHFGWFSFFFSLLGFKFFDPYR